MIIKKYLKFIENIENKIKSSFDQKSEEDLKIEFNDFNNKKSKLEEIYLNYKDENDLNLKLKSLNLIDSETKTFNNRFISMWSSIANYKRKLKNIEDLILNKEEQINSKNELSIKNPMTKKSNEEDIKKIKLDINLKKKELSDLKIKIDKESSEINSKIKEIIKNIK